MGDRKHISCCEGPARRELPVDVLSKFIAEEMERLKETSDDARIFYYNIHTQKMSTLPIFPLPGLYLNFQGFQ